MQGGPSSFVLEARRPADIAVVMRKKFLLDLVGPPPETVAPAAARVGPKVASLRPQSRTGTL